MRSWLGPSTVITFAYIVILLVVVVKDGRKSSSFSSFCSNVYNFALQRTFTHNVIILVKGKLTPREIMRSMETKQTEYSMPLVQLQLLSYATPPDCYSKYRFVACISRNRLSESPTTWKDSMILVRIFGFFFVYAVNSKSSCSNKYEESFKSAVYRGTGVLLWSEHSRILGLWLNCIRIPSSRAKRS